LNSYASLGEALPIEGHLSALLVTGRIAVSDIGISRESSLSFPTASAHGVRVDRGGPSPLARGYLMLASAEACSTEVHRCVAFVSGHRFGFPSPQPDICQGPLLGLVECLPGSSGPRIVAGPLLACLAAHGGPMQRSRAWAWAACRSSTGLGSSSPSAWPRPKRSHGRAGDSGAARRPGERSRGLAGRGCPAWTL